MSMRLKDKQTGEVDEYYLSNDPGYGVINASTGRFIGFDTLAELNEMFEDAPEDIKPFEEVAKVGYVVKLRYGRVDFVADEKSVDTLKVASCDYYEILPDGTKKTEFTWNEAMKIEKKTHGKWRVPTVPEWFAICAAFGRSDDGTDINPQILREKLGLTADEDGAGYYWSAASNSDTDSYSLSFYGTSLRPRNNDYKGFSFAVRCVAGGGE